MPKEILDTMEYVYAALLLHKLEKEVNEANISSVVKASGTEVNDAQVKGFNALLRNAEVNESAQVIKLVANHEYGAVLSYPQGAR